MYGCLLCLFIYWRVSRNISHEFALQRVDFLWLDPGFGGSYFPSTSNCQWDRSQQEWSYNIVRKHSLMVGNYMLYYLGMSLHFTGQSNSLMVSPEDNLVGTGIYVVCSLNCFFMIGLQIIMLWSWSLQTKDTRLKLNFAWVRIFTLASNLILMCFHQSMTWLVLGFMLLIV